MAGHGHVDHIGDMRIALLIAVLALFLDHREKTTTINLGKI